MAAHLSQLVSRPGEIAQGIADYQRRFDKAEAQVNWPGRARPEAQIQKSATSKTALRLRFRTYPRANILLSIAIRVAVSSFDSIAVAST